MYPRIATGGAPRPSHRSGYSGEDNRSWWRRIASWANCSRVFAARSAMSIGYLAASFSATLLCFEKFIAEVVLENRRRRGGRVDEGGGCSTVPCSCTRILRLRKWAVLGLSGSRSAGVRRRALHRSGQGCCAGRRTRSEKVTSE
jgi:hypothetical protein